MNVLFMGSRVECPDCKKLIHVGTGGYKNLDAHRLSKGCRAAASFKAPSTPKAKLNYSLHKFFKPQVPLNHCVYPPKISCPSSRHLGPLETQLSPLATMTPGGATKIRAKLCQSQRGIYLLQKLEAAANRIPNDLQIATPQNCLAVSVADPHVCCVAKPGEEEDWPIIN
jgi:hypothetical protein